MEEKTKVMSDEEARDILKSVGRSALPKIKDAISVRFEQFVMHFPCEYCGEPGKEIEIDVPTQPQSGGYGASFKGGKDIVTYCNECADSELDYCGECGIIARNDNIAIYGCKCKNV